MGQRIRKTAVFVVVMLVWLAIILFLATEFWDPWKLGLKDADYEIVNALTCLDDACELWMLPPESTFEIGDVTVTTCAAGQRCTPDANPDGAPLIFLGDSNTFGYLVEDDETFVNRFAQAHPEYHVENYGVWGYAINHYAQMVDRLPADATIIVFLTGNDHDPEESLGETIQKGVTQPRQPNLVRYGEVLWWTIKPDDTPLDDMSADEEAAALDWFMEYALAIADRVVFFGFHDDAPAEALAARGVDVCLLEPYPTDTYIGPFDGHPNPDGHAWIAREIDAACLPLLEG